MLALGIAILYEATRRQGKVLAGFAQQIIKCDGLRAENAQLASLRLDADELVRLRRENAEIPKLQRQLWQLRQTLPSQDVQETDLQRELRSEHEQLQKQQQALLELPNRAACTKNLELMDSAKTQWVQQNGLSKGETVTLGALASFFPDGFPTCPDGGHYSINRAGFPPACSHPGHSIP